MSEKYDITLFTQDGFKTSKPLMTYICSFIPLKDDIIIYNEDYQFLVQQRVMGTKSNSIVLIGEIK